MFSREAAGYGGPDLFYYDFHSESSPLPKGQKPRVSEYEQKPRVKESGSLIAPFAGIHGWYLQNVIGSRSRFL